MSQSKNLDNSPSISQAIPISFPIRQADYIRPQYNAPCLIQFWPAIHPSIIFECKQQNINPTWQPPDLYHSTTPLSQTTTYVSHASLLTTDSIRLTYSYTSSLSMCLQYGWISPSPKEEEGLFIMSERLSNYIGILQLFLSPSIQKGRPECLAFWPSETFTNSKRHEKASFLAESLFWLTTSAFSRHRDRNFAYE